MCLVYFGRLKSVLGCALLACLSLSAHAVVFQAENYNAFYDTTPANESGAYRNDEVNIDPTTDTGYELNVVCIVARDSQAYIITSIPNTGSNISRMRVASPVGGTAKV